MTALALLAPLGGLVLLLSLQLVETRLLRNAAASAAATATDPTRLSRRTVMKNRARTTTHRPRGIHHRPPVHLVHADGCLACPAPHGAPDSTRVPTDDVVVEIRPWGTFEQFVCNEQVTVKVITVEAGQRLSLQRHARRGEMWQVLDGPVDITLGARTWTAQTGERVWVPRGAVHRMGSSASTPARVLEVAFGPFDEDDIERLDDDYER